MWRRLALRGFPWSNGDINRIRIVLREVMSKSIKILFLLLGVGLLFLVIAETDTAQLWHHVTSVGFLGICLILIVYVFYFGSDVLSWQVVLIKSRLSLRWYLRLYAARMVGEAYNNITPTASLGGEPIKAWLLKANWGVPLRDSGSSLVITKTASMLSLSIFGALGVFLMLEEAAFSVAEKNAAIASVIFVIFSTIVFFLMQYLRFSSSITKKLGRFEFAKKLASSFAAVEDIDDQFVSFYKRHYVRAFFSCLAAMCSWLFGVLEIYVILYLIGFPLSIQEVLIVESVVQLVRVVTFFIPAGLGTQEGAFLFTIGALTGLPAVGVATALLRRFRDFIWIAGSLLLASFYSIKPWSSSINSAKDG